MSFQKIKKYIFISLIALVVVGGGIFVLLFISQRQTATSIEALLEDADESLSSGYYYKSEEATRKAYSISNSEELAIKVLKRAYKLSLANGNYRLLEELSGDALKRHPSSKTIVSIAIYGRLRGPHPLSALENVNTKQINEEGKTFLLEAALLSGSKIDGIVANEQKTRYPELALLDSVEPRSFEQMSAYLSDSRLLLDAALIYAKAGRISEAYGVVEQNIKEITSAEKIAESDTTILEPLLFIAYDADKLDDALNIQNRIPRTPSNEIDMLLVTADIELLKKNYSEAEKMYLLAIGSDPAYSAVPYLNSAWMYLMNGEVDKSIGYLENAHKYFPKSRNVSIELSRLHINQGNIEAARTLLADILSTNKKDTEAQLLLLYIDIKNLTVSQYRLRLWELFNKDPQNEILATLLLSNCLLFEDIESAQKAIRIVVSNTELPSLLPWLDYYKGLILALSGQPEEAIPFLREAYKKTGDCLYAYNLSAVLVKTRQFKEAEIELWKILRNIPDTSREDKRFYSNVSSLYAEALLMEGNLKDAKKYVENALKKDSGNYRALGVLSAINEQFRLSNK